ncbi:ABC transporter ATP-binding protein/permease [soil metagenome]
MKEQGKRIPYTVTFKRLLGMMKFFLQSPSGAKAKAFLAALFVLIVCISTLNVVNSYVGRYFMSAIEARDWSGFYRFAWFYVGVYTLQTLVAVSFRFFEERLGLHWRDWLTRRALMLYTDKRVYLHLELDGAISNPDQRIAEDIKALTVSTLSFSLMIVNGTMAALSFGGVLWTISPKLFAVAVVYAATGSVLTIFFGRPLVRLNYRQSDREADFRTALMEVRENAEGIALSDSEPLMRKRLVSRVDLLVENFHQIISINRNLGFFTTGYNYMLQLIPILIVAPLFMKEGVEFGVIGQSTMAFAALLGAFSLIVTQFQSISAYASVVARLSEFIGAVENAEIHRAASCIGCEMTADHFSFLDLTLLSTTEDHHVLLDKLNASFLPGRCIFVGGSNDPARKVLFRACAALHDSGSGSMVRPPADQITFLPEQPYLPPSNLRDMLLVSNDSVTERTDEEVNAVLKEVGLAPMIKDHDGFEKDCNWDEILSFEEKQLMAIARVILSKPTYVMMDRLESALPPEAQKRVLQLLAKRGISRVLFGRGAPDPTIHDAFLELHADGSWAWTELSRPAAA